MASLEVYELTCEIAGCAKRATRRLRTAAGTFHFYCTGHAGPALTEQSKKEAAAGAADPNAAAQAAESKPA